MSTKLTTQHLKNVPPLTSYNLDNDYDNFWQKCYWASKKSRDALFFHLTYLVLQHYLVKEETQKTAHWCIVREHSSTAAALSTSFLLNHAP